MSTNDTAHDQHPSLKHGSTADYALLPESAASSGDYSYDSDNGSQDRQPIFNRGGWSNDQADEFQTHKILSYVSISLIVIAASLWLWIWLRGQKEYSPFRYVCYLTALAAEGLKQCVHIVLSSGLSLTQTAFNSLIALSEVAEQLYIYILFCYVILCVIAVIRKSTKTSDIVSAEITSVLTSVFLMALRLGITHQVSTGNHVDFYAQHLFLITSIPKLFVSFSAFCMLVFMVYWSFALDTRRYRATWDYKIVRHSAVCLLFVFGHCIVTEIAWLHVYYEKGDARFDLDIARVLSSSKGIFAAWFTCFLDLEVLAYFSCVREDVKKKDQKTAVDMKPLTEVHSVISDDSVYETPSGELCDRVGTRDSSDGAQTAASSPTLKSQPRNAYGSITE